ncbi:hypothetical protein [Streptomyces europaeiscabiei]|uniref:hypothetical protein n=1 Tax=Streptomyces europaeiscabiei TaxID=146819 RepID=UPI0029B8E45D|nr:hypothetical protein [Streptomyces europaeiscabiei]MDX3666968.1 hypothetical protein [Streptomyces europaeiscabiei]
MAVSKIKLGKARAALVRAGMSPGAAAQYVRMLDINEPLEPQIIALAEDMPDLFGLDDDEAEDDDTDEPMTAAEAKLARIRGQHRLAPSRATGTTPAERNAAALGALRERSARPSTAPATAQAAAQRLRAGIGRSADGN